MTTYCTSEEPSDFLCDQWLEIAAVADENFSIQCEKLKGEIQE
jgi:hypothetical protein